MARLRSKPDLHSPRGTAILALALIAATALAGLLVMAIATRASATTASRVCRPDDKGQIRRPKLRASARKELVPRGAVSLTVCRYNGMNAAGGVQPFALLGAGVTGNHKTIARLSAELDALKPSVQNYMCPFDDGSQDVATFVYASGSGLVLTLHTKGCEYISNGHIERNPRGKPIVQRVSALAKPIGGPTSSATVTGQIEICGGAYPGACRTDSSMDGSVIITNSENQTVATASVQNGVFNLQIASPGTYTFEAVSADGQPDAAIRKATATVSAGATTNVVLTMDVP